MNSYYTQNNTIISQLINNISPIVIKHPQIDSNQVILSIKTRRKQTFINLITVQVAQIHINNSNSSRNRDNNIIKGETIIIRDSIMKMLRVHSISHAHNNNTNKRSIICRRLDRSNNTKNQRQQVGLVVNINEEIVQIDSIYIRSI